jgi:integrase
MAADKIGTAKKRRVNHQRLSYFINGKRIEYTRSKKLCFADITPQFLESYRNWLRTKNLSYNTIIATIKDIRTIFNLAIKQDVIDGGLSPFRNRKFVLGEMVNSDKEKLTKEEVQTLLNFSTDNKKVQLALDCFLFSFFTNGMRTSDIFMLKWSNITDGCITYRMIKNNKLVSDLKLPQKALEILERYKGNDMTYIFPMFYGYTSSNVSAILQNRKTASSLAMINKDLKIIARSCNIDKNLTMHIARHSFANIAKDGDTSVEIIKELLNHSSIKTTYSYLASFSNEKLQSATNKVYADFG